MKLYRIKNPGEPPEEVALDGLRQIVLGTKKNGGREVVDVEGDGPELWPVRYVGRTIYMVRGHRTAPGRCLAIMHGYWGPSGWCYLDILPACGVLRLACGWRWPTDRPEVLAVISPGALFNLEALGVSCWYTWNGEKWTMQADESKGD